MVVKERGEVVADQMGWRGYVERRACVITSRSYICKETRDGDNDDGSGGSGGSGHGAMCFQGDKAWTIP